MLAQRRSRWTNIKPTVAQCIVLAGMNTAGGGRVQADTDPMSVKCRASVVGAGHTLDIN